MQMDVGMDTGDIIEIEKTEIGDNETADELYDKLKAIAASLICKTLVKIENGTAVRKKQDDNAATYTPMIKKEMALIEYTKTAC